MSDSAIPLDYASKDFVKPSSGRLKRVLYRVSLVLIALGLGFGAATTRDPALVTIAFAIGGLLLGVAIPSSDGSSKVQP